ncbi:hypothetical protein LCGC14_1890310 [marine sediment metagenome]|uniref:Uncharacterized protein n=1 Tax=marine sediment metagenome TaxID=412755 RepID=A0A0F9FZY1_9ZZZZ
MIGTADLIPCKNGVQVEISLPQNWTLYSTIYRDEELARKRAESIAIQLRVDLTWNTEPSAT